MIARRRRRRWRASIGARLGASFLAVLACSPSAAVAQDRPAVGPSSSSSPSPSLSPPDALTPGAAGAQEVNRPNAPASACACALGGAWGACLTRPALSKVHDAAAVELPSCKRQLAARMDELAAEQALRRLAEARAGLLGGANADRAQAAEATARAASLTSPGPAAQRSWFERHAFGLGVAVGGLVVAGISLGVVYALLPARANSSSSKVGALSAPPSRWLLQMRRTTSR